jgi:hypothetical protein
LEEQISALLASLASAGIPIIFALSRKRLGEVYGFRKRVSAVALLDATGVEAGLARVLALAADGAARWRAAQGAGGGAPPMAPAAVVATAAAAAGAAIEAPPAGGEAVMEAAGADALGTGAAVAAADDENDDYALL